MNLDRLIKLIGNDSVEKIKKLNILIVGLGGVGGYAFESLVRCGIEKFTIIDKDLIEDSNLNRQIISLSDNVGESKVTEAKKRAIKINPKIQINDLNIFLDENNINEINLSLYNYVIDTCDTITTKKLLIENCIKNNIKIISSMGTARKLDATKLHITTLDKTNYDPLAKILRKIVDKNIQKKVIVINSDEEAKKTIGLGSNSYVPATAGLLITNYIINDVIKNLY